MPKGIPKKGVNKGWFKIGYNPSVMTRKKLSIALKGKKGHKQTKVTCQKLREINLGRYLEKTELIHHIDGDSTNNKFRNLFLTTKSGNTKAHHSMNFLLKDLLKDKIIRFNKKLNKYERCK